jgi:catalase
MSVCFDAVYVAPGETSSQNWLQPDYKNSVVEFINEAFRHCKAVYFDENTKPIFEQTDIFRLNHKDYAVILEESANGDENFIKAVASHRAWEFEKQRNGIKNTEHQS